MTARFFSPWAIFVGILSSYLLILIQQLVNRSIDFLLLFILIGYCVSFVPIAIASVMVGIFYDSLLPHRYPILTMGMLAVALHAYWFQYLLPDRCRLRSALFIFLACIMNISIWTLSVYHISGAMPLGAVFSPYVTKTIVTGISSWLIYLVLHRIQTLRGSFFLSSS